MHRRASIKSGNERESRVKNAEYRARTSAGATSETRLASGACCVLRKTASMHPSPCAFSCKSTRDRVYRTGEYVRLHVSRAPLCPLLA